MKYKIYLGIWEFLSAMCLIWLWYSLGLTGVAISIFYAIALSLLMRFFVKRSHRKMSAECDKCGEHILDCQCIDDDSLAEAREKHLELQRTNPDLAKLVGEKINEKESFRNRCVYGMD